MANGGRSSPFWAACLLGAVIAGACGGGASEPASQPTSEPTSGQAQPSYLQTPRGQRTLPEGAFGLGWAGAGEPVAVQREPLPTGYAVETVATGLDNPVDLAFFPDGRILVTEQYSGRVLIIQRGIVSGQPFAQIEHIMQGQLEQGLLGITVDPEFAQNHWVYVFYVEASADGDSASRSVLLRLSERDGLGVEPKELAELPTGFAGQHNGGGVRFGPDGKLYVSVGDTTRETLAPDPTELAGKILRLERDGSAPPDNPFVGQFGADPRVFATGFRNVFGFAFHPALGDALIALDNAEFEGDEIDIVHPGADYGWPDGGGEPPVWSYLNDSGLAGATVYTGSQLPAFQNELFFCQFHYGGPLHRVHFSPDFQQVTSDTAIATGCTATVREAPDGSLYFLDRNHGELLRIVGS